jgi:hypothetical protein
MYMQGASITPTQSPAQQSSGAPLPSPETGAAITLGEIKAEIEKIDWLAKEELSQPEPNTSAWASAPREALAELLKLNKKILQWVDDQAATNPEQTIRCGDE